MPYVDNVPHAGSAELLFTGMFDEPAGTIARTVPRLLVTNSGMSYNGTGNIIARAVALPAGMVVKTITLLTGTTAAVAPTHFWAGLTDIQLNVLGASADQGAGAIAASTYFPLALVTPVLIQSSGLYYVITSASAGTTMPTLAGGVNTAAGVAARAPIATGTVSNQVAPPAVGTQLNSGTITGNDNFNFAAWLS